MDGMQKIHSLDLSEYSAVIPVGGDGTINECINGMMLRPDRIPMGFIPNGSGDGFCAGIGIAKGDIDGGMKYIMSGQTVKVDLVKILIDYESEEELNDAIRKNATIKKENHLRYSCLNSGFALVAKVNAKAAWMKPYIGGLAYDVQAFKELTAGENCRFDIDIDAESLDGSEKEGLKRWKTDHETNFLMASNGKYGGGGPELFLSSAVINDGLFDVAVFKRPIGFCGGIALKDKTKVGGTHVYDEMLEMVRAKRMRVTNKLENEEPFQIDGEDLICQKFVQFEIMPDALEVLVDVRSVLNKYLDAGL